MTTPTVSNAIGILPRCKEFNLELVDSPRERYQGRFSRTDDVVKIRGCQVNHVTAFDTVE
jgi:hypothetical protein